VTADGNWNLVVSTPMGERRATLSLKADGGTLTGSQMADGSTAEIFDGTVNGNQLSQRCLSGVANTWIWPKNRRANPKR
jgi:hypothetical protein